MIPIAISPDFAKADLGKASAGTKCLDDGVSVVVKMEKHQGAGSLVESMGGSTARRLSAVVWSWCFQFQARFRTDVIVKSEQQQLLVRSKLVYPRLCAELIDVCILRCNFPSGHRVGRLQRSGDRWLAQCTGKWSEKLGRQLLVASSLPRRSPRTTPRRQSPRTCRRSAQ